jgi:hypothetical protein
VLVGLAIGRGSDLLLTQPKDEDPNYLQGHPPIQQPCS